MVHSNVEGFAVTAMPWNTIELSVQLTSFALSTGPPLRSDSAHHTHRVGHPSLLANPLDRHRHKGGLMIPPNLIDGAPDVFLAYRNSAELFGVRVRLITRQLCGQSESYEQMQR